MRSVATALLAIGLVITCLAGYRVLLFGVDLIAGSRRRTALRLTDRLLFWLAALGVVLLGAGIVLIHRLPPSP